MKVLLSLVLIYFLANTLCFAQLKFSITLMVEGTSSYTAYHNEPLIFTTSLVNKALQQNIQWNQAADAWLTEVAADYKAGKLSKEEFEKETELVTKGKKEVTTETIGTKQLPWFHQLNFRIFIDSDTAQASWPISILGDPLTDSIAVLDDKGYYLVMHHLSPEQVAKRNPGTYKIQILLAGVWSNTVTVKIRQENIPAQILKTAHMQLRLGNYYLQQKDAEKAMEYATNVLKKDPADIGGLILRGETYILKKNYSPALVDFKKALQQHYKRFPDLQEPPEYLLAAIGWLKKRQ
jgi:tetratricopeptide (TPR) repeat protein